PLIERSSEQIVAHPIGGGLGDPRGNADLRPRCHFSHCRAELGIQRDREPVDVHAYEDSAYRGMRRSAGCPPTRHCPPTAHSGRPAKGPEKAPATALPGGPLGGGSGGTGQRSWRPPAPPAFVT